MPGELESVPKSLKMCDIVHVVEYKMRGSIKEGKFAISVVGTNAIITPSPPPPPTFINIVFAPVVVCLVR